MLGGTEMINYLKNHVHEFEPTTLLCVNLYDKICTVAFNVANDDKKKKRTCY